MPSAVELAELDDDELATRLAEYRRELLNLRFQLATSQLDNPARLSAARRDVARVLTLMREREIAVAEGVQAPQAASARYLSRRRRVVAEELEMEPEGLEDEEVLVSGQDPMEGRLASESEFDDEQEEGA
jgi:large subunit ribosomal protein L29